MGATPALQKLSLNPERSVQSFQCLVYDEKELPPELCFSFIETFPRVQMCPSERATGGLMRANNFISNQSSLDVEAVSLKETYIHSFISDSLPTATRHFSVLVTTVQDERCDISLHSS